MTLWARARFACWMLVAIACFAGATANVARAESPGAYMQRVQNELIAAQRKGGAAAFSDVLRKHEGLAIVYAATRKAVERGVWRIQHTSTFSAAQVADASRP